MYSAACKVERDALSGRGSRLSLARLPTQVLFLIILMHMMNRELIPGRQEGSTVSSINCESQFIEDIVTVADALISIVKVSAALTWKPKQIDVAKPTGQALKKCRSGLAMNKC